MKLTDNEKCTLLELICSMMDNDKCGRIYLDYAENSKIRVSKKQVPEQVISQDLPLVKT